MQATSVNNCLEKNYKYHVELYNSPSLFKETILNNVHNYNKNLSL